MSRKIREQMQNQLKTETAAIPDSVAGLFQAFVNNTLEQRYREEVLTILRDSPQARKVVLQLRAEAAAPPVPTSLAPETVASLPPVPDFAELAECLVLPPVKRAHGWPIRAVSIVAATILFVVAIGCFFAAGPRKPGREPIVAQTEMPPAGPVLAALPIVSAVELPKLPRPEPVAMSGLDRMPPAVDPVIDAVPDAPAPEVQIAQLDPRKDALLPATPQPEPAAEAKPEPLPVQPAKGPAPAGPATECYGTRVEFVSDYWEATKRAVKEQKPMFVLHVSGNFEEARFT